MGKPKILVVAEPDKVGGIISNILSKNGFDVNVVDVRARAEKVHEELAERKYDMILMTNHCLSPSQIKPLIPEIKKKHPAIKIIVMSGYNTPEFARNLMEQGIDDLLPLPFVVLDLI